MNPLAHVLTSVGYPHRVRTVPPAEPPDLLRESEHRTAVAAVARAELGPDTYPYMPELPATRGWPDPYGPDPLVFGPYRTGERC